MVKQYDIYWVDLNPTQGGEIAADQIRTVDKKRLKKAIATLSSHEIAELQQILHQMFCL